MNILRQGLERYFTPQESTRLRTARVAIAGCGGLGSNTALMLARCGVEHLLLMDCDRVDASNLNRQQFWPRHVGQPKVAALADLLHELNPDIITDTRHQRLNRDTLPPLLSLCPIWVEALDDAAAKSMLVEQALLAGRQVVSGSGMAGYDGPPMTTRRMGKLTVVGDFCSDIADAPPLAPRVTQCAALLADAVLTLILNHPC